ncbi:MAG TPA: ABC transporter permease [Ilumatobacter sp.]|nr:ABC transporter permease [Ilumatobacter sp.]
MSAVIRRTRDALPALTLIAAGFGFWEVWVRVRDTPDYVLPPPSQIWTAFAERPGLVGHHLATTLAEAGIGLLIGTSAGVAIAALMATVPLARQVLGPLVVASQTVPMIVLAPLLVLWFGYGLTPKVIVVGLITFFPVAIATLGGLTGAPPEHVELIEAMGATELTVLRKVRVPHAIPALFDGLRIAAAYTIAGAVVAEWSGASRGLGIYLNNSQAAFRVDRVFVGVVVIAVCSTGLFLLVGGLARLVCPWYYQRERSRA